MPSILDRLRSLPLPLRVALLAAMALITIGLVVLLRRGGPWLGVPGVFAVGIAMTALSIATGILAGRLFTREPLRAPMRRYNIRIAIVMLIYVVLLLGVVLLYHRGWGRDGWGYVLAVVPALPIVSIFIVFALYMKEETDEFARLQFAKAGLCGAAATFAEATVWGFLETFHKAPHLPAYAVTIAFFVQYGIAGGVLARGYR